VTRRNRISGRRGAAVSRHCRSISHRGRATNRVPAPSHTVADNEPDWQDIDGEFENDNNNHPFLEYTGIKRTAANADTILDFFCYFLVRKLLK